MVACPYGVRTFFSDYPESYYPEVGASEYEKVKYPAFIKGTVKGCDFCMDRVADGKKPACVAACINEARFFGDLDNPESYVNKLIADQLDISVRTVEVHRARVFDKMEVKSAVELANLLRQR